MKEKTTMCSCYASDKEKLTKMKSQTNLTTMADAVRVCVEYAQSHGVFK